IPHRRRLFLIEQFNFDFTQGQPKLNESAGHAARPNKEGYERKHKHRKPNHAREDAEEPTFCNLEVANRFLGNFTGNSRRKRQTPTTKEAPNFKSSKISQS